MPYTQIRSCLYCCSKLEVADFDPLVGTNYICYQLFLCTPHAHVPNLPEPSNVNSNVNKIDLSASILPWPPGKRNPRQAPFVLILGSTKLKKTSWIELESVSLPIWNKPTAAKAVKRMHGDFSAQEPLANRIPPSPTIPSPCVMIHFLMSKKALHVAARSLDKP